MARKQPKICRQCGSEFPKFTFHDGKRIGLHRRSYCLDCRPLQLGHNESDGRRQLFRHKLIDGIEHKLCSKCQEFRLVSEFATHRATCKSCITLSRQKLRHEIKRKAVEYKGGRCQDCQCRFADAVYEFHHLDHTQKDFSIGNGRAYSWSKVKKELDKCVLLCANCHRLRHANDAA